MDSIAFGTRRVGVCYAARVAKALRRWNFTHSRVDIFVIHARVLAFHGVVYQSDICARLGITRPTMSVMMRRLERRGLIARRRSEEDRRKIVVQITELGRAAFGDVRQFLGPDLLTSHVNTFLQLHDFRTPLAEKRSRFLGFLGALREAFGDFSKSPYPP